MTPPTLWVARDGNGCLKLFDRDPTRYWQTRRGENAYRGRGSLTNLSRELCPDLAPGTCRRVTLRLEEET